MIDIEAYINALKIKWIKLLIDPSFQSSWKELEKPFFRHSLLSCLLRSTVKMETKLPKTVLPLQLMKN